MSRREQAGVIPFRRKKDTIEICLIRNKGRKKWKIPKGFVDPGETVEAGGAQGSMGRGRADGTPGRRADRVLRLRQVGLKLTVSVYLMEVTDQDDKWEESRFRERAWSPIDSAFARLKKHPVHPAARHC